MTKKELILYLLPTTHNSDIARQLNSSPSYVSLIRKAAGIQKPTNKRQGKYIERTNRIISLLPQMNDVTIAKELNISREWVRQVRKREGVLNPFKNQQMCSFMGNEEKLQVLIQGVKDGKSNKELGKELRDLGILPKRREFQWKRGRRKTV